MQSEFEALCSRAVGCRRCFDARSVAPSLIDIAQPRWVGPRYESAKRRVVVVMLNPGSGESRRDGADERSRQLIRAFADGSGSLDAVFEHQAADMPNWSRGRLLRFYIDGLGLPLDEIAFANVAWCATRGNRYPGPMLTRCFERHTRELLTILDPDVVLLSGSATHRFAERTRGLLPDSRVVPMLHYAHREGRSAEARELQRVRSEISFAGER
ncbi:MAG: hypothetical protein WCJ13_12105 [Coriobacteriia bacterium]